MLKTPNIQQKIGYTEEAVAKKPNSTKRRIENYTDPKKKRVNNPPVGLVTPDTDRGAGKKTRCPGGRRYGQ